MNPKTMTWRGLAIACGLALSAGLGCAGGVVGVDRGALSQGDVGVPVAEIEDVEIQPLSELPLDWVKRLPGPAQAFGAGIAAAYYRVIQADEDGKLVLFYLDDSLGALKIARLSDEGEIVQEAGVTAPEGWKGGDKTRIGIGGCNSAVCINDPLGIKVSWWTDGSDNLDWTMQKLLFSSDITKPPQRASLVNGAPDDLLQTTNGDTYAVTSDPKHHVTKRDAEGRVLWNNDNIVEGTWLADGYPSNRVRLWLSAVALDDGDLVLFTAPDGGQNYYASFIDADGKVTHSGTFLTNPRFLLNAGDHAVAVAPYDSGDLLVMHMVDPGHNKGVKFVREDYTLLQPEAAALDPSGNVYVATHNGSRLGAKPTLCRAAVSGGSDCYTLPLRSTAGGEDFRFDAIVARENGELYIHSGFDLVHVSYPIK